MSDDLALQMYDVQAQLIEMKEELGKVQKENEELRKQMTANHLMKTVNDFQRNYSNSFKQMEENLRRLTTTVSNHDDTFAKIQETLKDLKEAIKVQEKNLKSIGKETVLMLGGWDGGKMVDSLLILQDNGEYGNWKELSIKLPHAAKSHGAQFLNNYLYIFGGENEKKETLNSTYKLSMRYKWYTLSNCSQWDTMADMNEKRAGISNSSVIINDRILVIGGWSKLKGELRSVEMYDPQTNIWKYVKSLSGCRTLAAVAVACGKVFCCGGYNGTNFLNSTECYDPSSDVWTVLSDMPGPNGGCGAVVMDAHLIVIGGKINLTNFLNSVWVLDTTDKNAKWIEKQPSISLQRCQFSTAKVDDKIFVCGGVYIDKENSTPKRTNDMEIFDGKVWRNGPKLTTRRSDAPAVVIPIEFARSLS